MQPGDKGRDGMPGGGNSICQGQEDQAEDLQAALCHVVLAAPGEAVGEGVGRHEHAGTGTPAGTPPPPPRSRAWSCPSTHPPPPGELCISPEPRALRWWTRHDGAQLPFSTHTLHDPSPRAGCREPGQDGDGGSDWPHLGPAR